MNRPAPSQEPDGTRRNQPTSWPEDIREPRASGSLAPAGGPPRNQPIVARKPKSGTAPGGKWGVAGEHERRTSYARRRTLAKSMTDADFGATFRLARAFSQSTSNHSRRPTDLVSPEQCIFDSAASNLDPCRSIPHGRLPKGPVGRATAAAGRFDLTFSPIETYVEKSEPRPGPASRASR